MVWQDEDTNTCRLIQNRYSIENMSYSNLEDKVLSFTLGMDKGLMKKKPKGLIIEESTESAEEPALIVKPELTAADIASKPIVYPGKTIPMDNPIYGKSKDGISWKIKEYNDLWNSAYFPVKLKAVIRQNNEWMKKFMHSCVNLKQKGKACEIIEPDELIIPPRISESGQYDFGVDIYNQLFNNMPETLQETYLTFYKTNEQGEKDYTKLISELNRLVADETGFTKTRGFI
jgi:hypothetical protein